MKQTQRKWLALLLAAALAGSMFAGCGGQKADNNASQEAQPSAETETAETETEAEPAESEAETDASQETAESAPEVDPVEYDYTFMIDKSVDAAYYDEYEENPVARYWMSQIWDVDGVPSKINVDFSVPPAGGEKDYVNTLIATGDYPNIMAMAYSSTSVAELYEEGVVTDLTEYVEKYMPNYLALVESKEAYRKVTNDVEGERRFLQLYSIDNVSTDMWCGYQYRRDWILKYGKNPETGEAFTGGWNEDHTEWEDDIVFPSGNTDPIYISDWEWMLPILAQAREELGIEEGFVMSLFYPGYMLTGDFISGFGASSAWYIDKDGKAKFGGTSDGFRAYLECVSNWYKQGWIDPAFDERTGDMFFNIDNADTYSGRVGACCGQMALLGSSIADESDPCRANAMFMGAPQPINDVYGSKECQGKDPFCYYANAVINASFIVTTKTDPASIPAFLTAVDSLYTYEGGLMRTRGFSDVQQAELQDEFYNANGLENGAYTIETDEDGNDVIRYHLSKVQETHEGLEEAAVLLRVMGQGIQNIDRGYSGAVNHSLEMWKLYPVTGYIDGTVTAQLTAEEASENGVVYNAVKTYMDVNVADFVAGRRDISDDAEWEAFCKGLEELHPETYTDNINRALGN